MKGLQGTRKCRVWCGKRQSWGGKCQAWGGKCQAWDIKCQGWDVRLQESSNGEVRSADKEESWPIFMFWLLYRLLMLAVRGVERRRIGEYLRQPQLQ